MEVARASACPPGRPTRDVQSRQIASLQRWCRRAVHLQCASGDDTPRRGYEVIGIDISDEHIKNARWTSDQLDGPAIWYRCDVLDTPS